LWVIITLTSLAVLVILVLLVPLDIVVQVNMPGRPRFSLKLLWLFGLIGKEVTGGKKVVKERRKPGEGKRNFRYIIEMLPTKDLIRQLNSLVKDILRRFKIKNLVADLSVGLGDPADTGLIFALIGPAAALLNSSSPLQIRAQPSFEDDADFAGYSQGMVRLWPIQMVAPLLRFTFSLPAIGLAKKLILTKFKRKRMTDGKVL